MRRQTNLALVSAELRGAREDVRAVRATCEHAIDIYTAERERIEQRDWAAVHVAGDRARALPSWFGRRG